LSIDFSEQNSLFVVLYADILTISICFKMGANLVMEIFFIKAQASVSSFFIAWRYLLHDLLMVITKYHAFVIRAMESKSIK
jgi:hypothetical protein